MSNTPKFRKIFPSYHWGEDVWRVNQIVNKSHVLGAEAAGFIKNVENEQLKLASDAKVKAWIDEQAKGCSCMITFVGEKTYQRDWVKYEMELAISNNMGKLIVFLDDMKDMDGSMCKKGIDPYKYHGMYSSTPSSTSYEIKQYSYINDNGKDNIADWIEDACKRAGK